MALTPEQSMALLEATIQDAPPFVYEAPLTEADLRWLGRAEALLEATDSLSDLIEFQMARNSINSYSHSRDKLLRPLHTAYFRAELKAPDAMRGSFIPAGDTWNGYAAIVKLLQGDCDDLLLVDPYMTAELFTDFMPHCAARKGARCLTAKRNEYHPALAAAFQRWSNDNVGKTKPVEVRYSSNGALHDRLIIIDGKEAWLVSQSLKDIAKRSPASVTRAEAELGLLKAEHYNEVWSNSALVQ